MTWDSKIVWSEGMFLRPQHFQQHDRYIQSLLENRCSLLRPYAWGITELVLDQQLLAIGKLAVTRCRGVLPDGTPFRVPHDEGFPLILEVPEEVKNTSVFLCLPLQREGDIESDVSRQHMSGLVRFVVAEQELSDSNEGMDGTATVQIGKLRLRLALEREHLENYVRVGVARVRERRTNGSIVLDEGYIPPSLSCRATPTLSGFLQEIQGLLHHWGEALRGRVSAGGRSVAEIAHFLLLQVVNRYEPLFNHLNTVGNLHPEEFYRVTVQLAGELSTFQPESPRPRVFPPYQHEDLQGTFGPIMVAIREMQMPEAKALEIPLKKISKFNIHLANIPDRTLLAAGRFILVTRADIPSETLRRQFPRQVKIGPPAYMEKIVGLQIPGIQLYPLEVAPRQIPFYAGGTYFELERTGKMWKRVVESAAVAFHVAGEFPGLVLTFWAIKE